MLKESSLFFYESFPSWRGQTGSLISISGKVLLLLTVYFWLYWVSIVVLGLLLAGASPVAEDRIWVCRLSEQPLGSGFVTPGF